MDTYERKIRKIKRCIKNYVVENSSLCDQVSRIQDQITTSNLERDFLLKKLMENEPQSFDFIQQSSSGVNDSATTTTTKYKKRKNSDTNSEASEIKKKTLAPMTKKQTNAQQNPRLPVILTDDGITILNYGKIITDRPAYRNSDGTIYPVGYKIARVFNGSNYICRVLDNGSPLFEIYKENDPAIRFNGPSTDDVHASMLQMFDSNSIIMPDGDRFFGLKNKTVISYLNQLPNAKKISKLIRMMKQEEIASRAFIDHHQQHMF